MKEVIEKNSVVFCFLVLIAGFTAGMGAYEGIVRNSGAVLMSPDARDKAQRYEELTKEVKTYQDTVNNLNAKAESLGARVATQDGVTAELDRTKAALVGVRAELELANIRATSSDTQRQELNDRNVSLLRQLSAQNLAAKQPSHFQVQLSENKVHGAYKNNCTDPTPISVTESFKIVGKESPSGFVLAELDVPWSPRVLGAGPYASWIKVDETLPGWTLMSCHVRGLQAKIRRVFVNPGTGAVSTVVVADLNT